MLWNRIFAKKSLEMLDAEAKGENRLLRVLGPVGLTEVVRVLGDGPNRHGDALIDVHDVGVAGTESDIVCNLPDEAIVTELFHQQRLLAIGETRFLLLQAFDERGEVFGDHNPHPADQKCDG